jgi:hypothetical protein
MPSVAVLRLMDSATFVDHRQLNERPRKTLGFETPAERFNAVLHRSLELAAKSRHSAGSFDHLVADGKDASRHRS